MAAILVSTCGTLSACGSAGVPSPTPSPVIIATPAPPVFAATPNAAGHLLLDYGLGDIWQVELRSGAVTRIHTSANVFPTQLNAPPSGSPFAYAATAFVGDGTNGRFGIYISDTQVITPEGGLSYQDPTWTSDGQTLFVTRVGVAPTDAITGSSGLTIQRFTPSGATLSTIAHSAFQPAPSPNGSRLAYVRVDVSRPLSPTRSIRVLTLTSGEDREIVPPNQFYDVYAPRWLNNTQLVFSAARDSALGQAQPSPSNALAAMLDAILGHVIAFAHSWTGNLWRINADGSGLTRISAKDFQSPIVASAPDGQTLAVMSMEGVWLMNADGTALRQISRDGGNGSIVWVR